MLIRLGLLDTDFRYINKLADYFGHHYNREVEVRQFSDSRTLMDSLNRHERLDVLLASPDAVSDPASLPAGLQFAYLAEDMRDSSGGVPAICKYQRADALFRAVEVLAENVSVGKKGDGACRLILFTGAIGGIGCSTAAVSCAVRSAAQGTETLYINLQSHGRTDSVFSNVGAPMTRVLYEIKSWLQINKKEEQAKENLGKLQTKLRNLALPDPQYKVFSFDGFNLPLEAMDLNPDDINALVKALPGMCDCCVLDMDSAFSPVLFAAMKHADEVVIVSDGSTRGNVCLSKILESINILNGTDNPILRGGLGVLYTHFGSAASQVELPAYAKLIGTIPNYAGADEKRIVDEMIGSSMFDAIG